MSVSDTSATGRQTEGPKWAGSNNAPPHTYAVPLPEGYHGFQHLNDLAVQASDSARKMWGWDTRI